MASILVVPLDGSDLARSALTVGEQLARAFGGSVLLLTSGWGSTVEELEAQLAAEAQRLEVPTSTSVVPDTFPATAIAQAAGADPEAAVVIATHGRSGIGRALLGSVAEDVLRATDRPVTLVGPSTRPGAAIAGGTMVTATDGSPTSMAVVPRAARWARDLALRVRVVAVTDDAGAAVGAEATAGLGEALEHVAQAFRDEGVAVEITTIVGSDAAKALVSCAKEVDASLIAMTTHARTGWDRTALGSVAMKVVHDAPCPVLVQKPGT